MDGIRSSVQVLSGTEVVATCASLRAFGARYLREAHFLFTIELQKNGWVCLCFMGLVTMVGAS